MTLLEKGPFFSYPQTFKCLFFVLFFHVAHGMFQSLNLPLKAPRVRSHLPVSFCPSLQGAGGKS